MMKSAISSTAEKLSIYRSEVENELERILHFWVEQAIDVQSGGFIGQMDNHGHVNKEAPKGGVLNARILWTFSAAYRETHKQEYLEVAQRAYKYLMNHFLDREFGGIYWSVDKNGKPHQTRKQIYALAFAIYGLSEYYMATSDAMALQASQDLFQWIEKYSYDWEHDGYFEAFGREGEGLEDLRLSEKDRNDPKTMNTHLHILEAYANLYRLWPDRYLAQQLEALLVVFLEKIVDGKTGHMNLFFTENWKVTSDLVSYGHDIEASWLLLEAAEVLGNEELIEKVQKVALKMAWATTEGLQPDGSLYHELNRQTMHFDKHREWWVSAEAMVGFLNAYQLNGEEGFLEKSLHSWEFSKKNLLDRENGEWYWGVYHDNSLMESEDKIGFWKCPYHNSRACLEVANRCKMLIQED